MGSVGVAGWVGWVGSAGLLLALLLLLLLLLLLPLPQRPIMPLPLRLLPGHAFDQGDHKVRQRSMPRLCSSGQQQARGGCKVGGLPGPGAPGCYEPGARLNPKP